MVNSGNNQFFYAPPDLASHGRGGSESGPSGGRPRSVWIATMLFVLASLLSGGTAALVLALTSGDESVDSSLDVLFYVMIAVSVAQITVGVFLWLGHGWARIIGTVMCGISLAGGIFILISGNVAAISGIGLNGGILRLLWRSDVRDWCDRSMVTDR